MPPADPSIDPQFQSPEALDGKKIIMELERDEDEKRINRMEKTKQRVLVSYLLSTSLHRICSSADPAVREDGKDVEREGIGER